MFMIGKLPAGQLRWPKSIACGTYRHSAATVSLIVLFLLAGCKTGGDSVSSSNPSPNSDTTSPRVTITSPTSNSNYSSLSSFLNVAGSATDNVAVAQVSWQVAWSSGGGSSGSASGTGSWNVSNVPLQAGSNVITVTARDSAGNSGSDQLTVNYTPNGNDTATVSWNSNTEPDLAGYRVYYGTQSGQYDQAKGNGIVVTGATNYTISGLNLGTRYYFAVTAFDTSGNESGYSQEVFKDILP